MHLLRFLFNVFLLLCFIHISLFSSSCFLLLQTSLNLSCFSRQIEFYYDQFVLYILCYTFHDITDRWTIIENSWVFSFLDWKTFFWLLCYFFILWNSPLTTLAVPWIGGCWTRTALILMMKHTTNPSESQDILAIFKIILLFVGLLTINPFLFFICYLIRLTK